MKPFAITIVAIFVALAAAAPHASFEDAVNGEAEKRAEVESTIEKRANGGVYICNNINFVAPCAHLVNPFGDCINFDSNFNDQVSAVGPDSGSVCTFYVDYGCSGANLDSVSYPGISDLRTVGFNDKLSSYYCTN